MLNLKALKAGVENSPEALLKELIEKRRPDHVVFIVRPGKLTMENQNRTVDKIINPEGRVVLEMFDRYS